MRRDVRSKTLFQDFQISNLCSVHHQSTIVFPPVPKKGMVRLLKKGHFLTRDNMSKGHFQRANESKKGTF